MAETSKQKRLRGASRYRETETKRLLKAAAAAGFPPTVLEVDHVTGTMRVLFCQPDKPSDPDVEQWMSKQNAHKR
jgi:hypothetical protein